MYEMESAAMWESQANTHLHEQPRLDLNHCWSCVPSLFKTLFVFFPHTQSTTYKLSLSPSLWLQLFARSLCFSSLLEKEFGCVCVFLKGGGGLPGLFLIVLFPHWLPSSLRQVCVFHWSRKIGFIIDAHTHIYKSMSLSLSQVMIYWSRGVLIVEKWTPERSDGSFRTRAKQPASSTACVCAATDITTATSATNSVAPEMITLAITHVITSAICSAWRAGPGQTARKVCKCKWFWYIMHTERKKGGDSCCDMFSNATGFCSSHNKIKIDFLFYWTLQCLL